MINSDFITTNDFNKQLYLMLSQDHEDYNIKNNEDLCLITNKPLENPIELVCGHKFNYESIFNEVVKQKKKYNHLEVTRLKNNQIKCPYCRTIQNGLLPYKEGFEKIRFVNYPEALCLLPDKCNYIFASGKKKGMKCAKGCSGEYCNTHKKIMEKREQKKLLKQEKNLEKQAKQEKKNLEKEHKKLLKQNVKLKKELKTKQKNIITEIQNIKIKTPPDDPMIKLIDKMLDDVKSMKLTNVENKVSNIKTLLPTCSYVFKRGKNKGMHCMCKKIHQDGLCKMHYKLQVKSENKLKQKLEKINPQVKIENIKIKKNKTIIKIKK